MLLNVDSHCLIMEFLSWEQLFLCKQVAQSWNQTTISIKRCFCPSTLHGMPAWVLMFAWIFTHLKEIRTGWTLSDYGNNVKEEFKSKMFSLISRKHFSKLFKRESHLDTTQMSKKSQIFLRKTGFIGNLTLDSLKVNYWLIHDRYILPRKWFGNDKHPVQKLIIVTQLPYIELFEYNPGGKVKELEVISHFTMGPPFKKYFTVVSHLTRVYASNYEFTEPSFRANWYINANLLYLEDAKGVYQRNKITEPFTFVAHDNQHQQQSIISKRAADKDSHDQSNTKKQKKF